MPPTRNRGRNNRNNDRNRGRRNFGRPNYGRQQSNNNNNNNSNRRFDFATPIAVVTDFSITDLPTVQVQGPNGKFTCYVSSAESKGGVALTNSTDAVLDTYGAGKVSAHKALLGSSEYWINNWVFNATWLGGWTFGDFAVPANCRRITVCLTYVEPEASAGPSES